MSSGGIAFSGIRAINSVMKRLRPGLATRNGRHRAWALLWLVTISLAMTGFAHRAMPIDRADSFPTEARHVLPGDTTLDLCTSDDDGHHADHGGACEFCRIASASHSLDALPVLGAIRFRPARTAPPESEAVPVLLADYGNPARAPPHA